MGPEKYERNLRNQWGISNSSCLEGFIHNHQVLLLSCEFVVSCSSPPYINFIWLQPLANIGEKPFVWDFECFLVARLFRFPPKSPPGLLGSLINDVAVGRDGYTRPSSTITIGGNVFDQVDIFLVTLEIGFWV